MIVPMLSSTRATPTDETSVRRRRPSAAGARAGLRGKPRPVRPPGSFPRPWPARWSRQRSAGRFARVRRQTASNERGICGFNVRGGAGACASNLPQHLVHRTDKRRLARQDLIQDSAQGIDIAAFVQLVNAARSLFRRHVGRRTQDTALHGSIGGAKAVRFPGSPQVWQTRAALSPGPSRE